MSTFTIIAPELLTELEEHLQFHRENVDRLVPKPKTRRRRRSQYEMLDAIRQVDWALDNYMTFCLRRGFIPTGVRCVTLAEILGVDTEEMVAMLKAHQATKFTTRYLLCADRRGRGARWEILEKPEVVVCLAS